MKRPPEGNWFVDLDGQVFASLKDGLFLKYPELVDSLWLLPTDKLNKFFSVWDKIRKDKCGKDDKRKMITQRFPVQVDDSYFYVDAIVMKRPEETSLVYFRDFRQITLDDVLDNMSR